MKAEQVPVSADHLKAGTKLVKVDEVDGKPVETLETTVTADPLDTAGQVNGLTVTGGTLTATITSTMPADATGTPTAMDMHMGLKMTGTAGGGAATAEISMDRSVHTTMTPKP